MQDKQHETELFLSNKKTNFDSGDEIRFGKISDDERSDLDIEYDE